MLSFAFYHFLCIWGRKSMIYNSIHVKLELYIHIMDFNNATELLRLICLCRWKLNIIILFNEACLIYLILIHNSFLTYRKYDFNTNKLLKENPICIRNKIHFYVYMCLWVKTEGLLKSNGFEWYSCYPNEDSI